MSFKSISVIGLGYIGLPTAAMLASKNKIVIGVDINNDAVKKINKGMIHIVEPDLESLVYKVVKNGFLKATLEFQPADAFIITVPTPFKDVSSNIPEPDLSYVKTASESIAQVLKKGDLIILESTSPVGTTEQISKWLANIRDDLIFPHMKGKTPDINIAYCPERVLPGNIIKELINNDRVIGGMTPHCSQRAIDLYNIFIKSECFVTNSRTAEMSKLTENSCRDVQIAFANELSIICNELDINVWELIDLANRHPRINILKPGTGVGGHCIAVDPWFIASKSPEESILIQTARRRNLDKTQWVIEDIIINLNDLALNNNNLLGDNHISFWGLAFKPDIDDLRESPALLVIEKITSLTSNYSCVEPNISNNDKYNLLSIEESIQTSNIIVLLVGHKEFYDADILSQFNGIILDYCGALKK